MEDNKLPKRKNIRLKEWDYSANDMYYITICTKDKKHIFWDKRTNRVGADSIRPQYKVELSEKGEIVRQAIENIPKYYENVFVDKYVIMPNHIHMIIGINRQTGGRMISAPTDKIFQNIGFKGIWKNCFSAFLLRPHYPR